ncbi:MAG: TPM domain-containing protein [Salinivirgaceae bacterium]|nr:TPM domain-containing protein [Salinivirgaceae bacterium]
MKPSEFLSIEQKTRITEAIKAAELDTSGEIRLHIESSCSVDVLDRAAYIFSHLDMHKTKERNGVLFYLALDNHQFAILGDAGINHKVPANFWDTIKETMLADFKDGKMADGIEKGIRMAGEQLKAHFPYQSDDVNELSDEISYGK